MRIGNIDSVYNSRDKYVNKRLLKIIEIANSGDSYKAYKEIECYLKEVKNDLPHHSILQVVKLKIAILCQLKKYEQAKQSISDVIKSLPPHKALFFYLFKARLCSFLKEYRNAFYLYEKAIKIDIYAFTHEDIVIFTKLSALLLPDFDIKEWSYFLSLKYGYVKEVQELLFFNLLKNHQLELSLFVKAQSIFFDMQHTRQYSDELITSFFPQELKGLKLYQPIIRWLAKKARASDFHKILQIKIEHPLYSYIALEQFVKGYSEKSPFLIVPQQLYDYYGRSSSFYLLLVQFYLKSTTFNDNRQKILTHIDYGLSFCNNKKESDSFYQILKREFCFSQVMIESLLCSAELYYFLWLYKKGNDSYLPLIKEATNYDIPYFSDMAKRVLTAIYQCNRSLNLQL